MTTNWSKRNEKDSLERDSAIEQAEVELKRTALLLQQPHPSLLSTLVPTKDKPEQSPLPSFPSFCPPPL